MADMALVEIVIPVYNEQHVLEQSVKTLRDFLLANFPYRWRITIADNASTDATWAVAQRLAVTVEGVSALHLDQKGRGRALRYAWTISDADVVSYMDVDLSTGLDAFLPLVQPLVEGKSDIAIGSRLARSARIERQLKREVLSQGYNLLIKTAFGNPFSDAQCGFKALRAEVAREVLPLVENNTWFFDTEMLLLAKHNGLRLTEVPVRWIEDRDSRVNIRKTVTEDLQGLWRMRLAFWRGEGRLHTQSAPIHAPALRQTTPVA